MSEPGALAASRLSKPFAIVSNVRSLLTIVAEHASRGHLWVLYAVGEWPRAPVIIACVRIVCILSSFATVLALYVFFLEYSNKLLRAHEFFRVALDSPNVSSNVRFSENVPSLR